MELPDELEGFRKKLQDPTCSEGAWNLFYGLWGLAQSQPCFDHVAWLAVRDYFKGLEARLPPQGLADLGVSNGEKDVRMSNLQSTTGARDSV